MPVNYNALKIQFEKQVFNTNQFRGLALGAARRRVEAAQNAMIEAFEENKVTKELEGGVRFNGDSIISYHSDKGQPNLYSFIGFSEGTDPLAVLRELLSAPIEVVIATRRGSSYYIRVLAPKEKDIEDATPMPSEYMAGEFSWARGVEDGDLIGIGNYLAIEASASRSGKGIQIRFGNLDNSIEAVPYITSILEAFKKRLQQISK